MYTNNSNRALTGFWIESSLKISPREQVEVMERIFGEGSAYSTEALNELKQVMLVPGAGGTGVSIYGKTGMGKDCGVVVDAWFTGFAESAAGDIFLRAPGKERRHGRVELFGQRNSDSNCIGLLCTVIFSPADKALQGILPSSPY